MQITVTGRHLDISESFRDHCGTGIQELIERFQVNAIDTTITLSKHTQKFCSDIMSHIGRGVTMRAHGEGLDAYASFAQALATLAQQLRKHKRRLQDHHKHRDQHVSTEHVPYFVLNGESPEHADHQEAAPAIIAEVQKEVPQLSVGDAVMRMDLSSEHTMVFRNQQSGRLNVIYRRSDGNIGWVDPQGA